MVTDDRRSEREWRRSSRKKDLVCGSISLQSKKRIVKVFAWSIILYGSETRTLQKSDIKRLEAFEMWIWREANIIIQYYLVPCRHFSDPKKTKIHGLE